MRKPPLVFRHFADGEENITTKNVARLVEVLDRATAAKRDLIVLINSRGGNIEEFLNIEPMIETHKSRGLLFGTATYLEAYSTGIFVAASGSLGCRVAIPEAKFQIHQSAERIRDMEVRAAVLKTMHKDLASVNRRMCKYLAKYSAVNFSMWHKIMLDLPGNDDEFTLSAVDALQTGVIDKISSSPLETLVQEMQNSED